MSVSHWQGLYTSATLPTPAWLADVRSAAMERFAESGFPARHGGWRHTNVAGLTRIAFGIDKTASEDFELPAIGVPQVVFLDGRLLRSDAIDGSITVGSLRAELASGGEDLREVLADGPSVNGTFTALNTALMEDGAVVRISGEGAVHLVFASTTQAATHLRNLILVAPGSDAVVVEHYVGGDGAYFTNAVTDVRCAAGSRLQHVRLQEEGAAAWHVADVRVHQARDSRYDSFAYASGSKLSRVGIRVELAEPGAETELIGLYLGRERQHHDHTTVVEHAAPHCRSNEVYKGILDDRARGVFSGLVHVHPAGQKTVAEQSNRNMLLSDKAHADSEPQLEIHADDVRCAHGSAIGRLDEDALFYLRARGIGLHEARTMLTHAFAREVVESLRHDDVRQAVEGRIAGWLQGATFGREMTQPALEALDFDVEAIRDQFPILHQEVRGKPLVYLDNAATTQKPQAVIDAIDRFYSWGNANVHRGVHALSERATVSFDDARRTVQRFLGAADEREIVFTRGTTEAINLVANTFGRRIGPGDEIVLSNMEHHSDIVPWQLLCERVGATIVVLPITDRGELEIERLDDLITERTKLVGCVYVSNALGTINPVERVIEIAHARGVPVLLDAAQATAHVDIDVQKLDVDFLAMSGHKVYAPTGIGALYAKRAILEELPPWQGGGDMILSVDFGKTTYNRIPFRFEAGTPNVSGAIGMATALNWLTDIGVERAAAHEEALRAYATEALESIDGVRIVGTADHKVGVLSFVMKGVHPHDIGTIVDQEGVAIRTGHHCTQPLMKRLGVTATARASLAIYNTRDDVDRLVAALHRVQEVFA